MQTLILALSFITCLACIYASERFGEQVGYKAGRLSVYEHLMDGAVYNLADLPVREARK